MGAFFSNILAKIAALAAYIGQLFTNLFQTFVNFAQFLLDCTVQMFVDSWEMVTDVPVWIFESLLDIVSAVLASINFTPINNALSAFGQVPADIANLLGLLGVGEALAVISAALAIRILLQLIPFVRLGS